ncbi:MAG TPA: beta-ketoacyl-[acyl-carrier-protein] synthase family protein [bacterium]|nr:beta-ketoacyl-[acyl-carrier-protein] synthase family protein [bacterium]
MRTTRRKVVVTGLGAVTPLGRDVASMWDAMKKGRGAVSRISLFDASGFPTRIAGEVKGWDTARDVSDAICPRKLRKYLDRKTAFAVKAAAEAMAQAGLAPGKLAAERFGVAMGTEAGRPLLEQIADRILEAKRRGLGGAAEAGPTIDERNIQAALDSLDPVELVREMPHTPAAVLALIHGAKGPNTTVSTACTSSAQSVGDAFDRVRRGEVDVMLAGGCDALVEAFMVTGFSLLGALSQRNDDPVRASRPFDAGRDGFVLAEGAGFVVLEAEEHAKARGARVLSELAGFGASSNAWRITDSPPDGRGAWQSMRFALEDAGLTPDDVGYINAHGTSTQQNDLSETNGIKRLLGDRAKKVPVSSTKSMMGHLVAACGAVELVACVKAMEDRVLPPTINYDTPDPACDLDYVPNEARPAGVDVMLTNSFGFGGSNGTIAIRRAA